MEVSVFDVIGPIMIGPSSSHTAGAVRMARVARELCPEKFNFVSFGLHGSFAHTYKGHGTDFALVGGALGLREDDERISHSFELAKQQGISYTFSRIDIPDAHENSARISFYDGEKLLRVVEGSSVGGSQIVIRRLDGYSVNFSASMPTLIVCHQDTKGMVSQIAGLLADNDMNIATMHLSRSEKGGDACSVIEIDGPICEGTVEQITAIPYVQNATAVQLG